MKKRIVATGIAFIIIGVVIFFVSSSAVESHSSVSSKMSSTGNGKWVSSEITSSSSTDIILTYSSNLTLGLVPAKDLSSVNSGSLQEYAVNLSQNNTASGEHINSYLGDTGHYYVVAFSSSQPQLHYTIVNDYHYVSKLDFVNFVAIMIGAAGIVVSIIGLILGRRGKRENPAE